MIKNWKEWGGDEDLMKNVQVASLSMERNQLKVGVPLKDTHKYCCRKGFERDRMSTRVKCCGFELDDL